ncbi:MAG: TlpA disulfide reductase family protein [Pirellulaceae bacterium]|nr:TlpA disulfide reductase family protein [Pirellulaceae bacterium]
MKRLSILRRAVVLTLLVLFCLWLYGPVHAENRLSIGAKAPALNISDWIQQGVGKYPKVTNFESGNVYVVEFWATWCGPCIKSMPHLAKLQQDYADRKVQIISVSDEPVDEVREFLKRQAGSKDGEAVTFDELTKVYSLTTDPDESTKLAYPVAAKLSGIPCAFIVGKDGKIEWIGHPMEIDKPLEQVVEDRWDRDAFASQYNEEQDLQSLKETLAQLLQDPTNGDPSPAKIESAFEMVDGFLGKIKSPSIIKQTRFLKFDLMIQFRSEDPAVVTLAQDVFKDFSARPIELASLTWGIYEFSNAGHIKNPKLVLEAIKATEAVLPQVPADQKGTVLDTIAHLQFQAGDLEAALKSAREAVKAPGATPDFEVFIGQIETELKKKQKTK